MKYISTRNTNNIVEAHDAIKQGIAEDGGLYVPENIPQVSLNELEDMLKMNYREVAKNILLKYLDDFNEDEIKYCVDNAYNVESFDTDDIVELHNLDENTEILELWHGPTYAFKDLALQILPHLLKKSIEKSKDTREVVILTATSGDTGKAALEGFKDIKGTKIIVFYPQEGVSNIQKLQMVTQKGDNTFVVSVDGNFDDAQTGVKKIFTDKEFKALIENNGYVFSSANSINLGRLVPQIIYYFWGYLNMVRKSQIKMGEKINVVVPTGNFGNILAGFYAKKMGLPLNKLICASNSNNVLTEFIRTGCYNKNRGFIQTNSPSMDIIISSNLERLLFNIASDKQYVKKYMDNLNFEGFYNIEKELKQCIDENFWASYCDDNTTLETIKSVYSKYNYVVDTHTAVAINVLEQYRKLSGDDTKTIVASTASPFKFSGSVLSAIFGENQLDNDEYVNLEKLSDLVSLEIPKNLKDINKQQVLHKTNCSPDSMKQVVKNILENA